MYLEYRGASSKFWFGFRLFCSGFVGCDRGYFILCAGLCALGNDLYVFVAPVSSLYGVAELGVKATPLILIAIGLSLGFRANVWNIGAEGQLIFGALLAGGYALWGPENIWMLRLCWF